MRKTLPESWGRLARAERRTRRATAIVRRATHAGTPPDGVGAARLVGLRYASDHTPGIRRLGRPPRFRYVDPVGGVIRDTATIARIRSLAIPPAWTRVWISPSADTHIQATGRDARGRKQYRYHPAWRRIRDEVKYGRLIAFAQALPKIRAAADRHLARPGLPREKVLAAVVRLLEKTLIRVGNEEYARHNGSVGLTTMKDGHAKVRGHGVRFEFRGKSGIRHAVDLDDRRLARVVRACRELPGYELFQCVDEDGRRQAVDSADVNAYLRAIGGDDFSAKDFRTWAGTVLAAQALAACGACRSPRDGRNKVVAAVESVARRLGNTRSVCRKCYIHPAILDAYLDGATIASAARRAARGLPHRLSPEESAVVALISRSLARSPGAASSRPAARRRISK